MNITNRANVKLNHGFKYFVTIIDLYPGTINAQPMKTKTAKEVLNALISIFKEWKLKLVLIESDNGIEFHGVVSTFLVTSNIKRYFSKHHQPLSKIEITNQIIRHSLNKCMFIYKFKVWVDLLKHVIENHNKSIDSITGKTHNFLFNLRSKKEIHYYYQKMIEAGQKRLKKKTFKFKHNIFVGDEVRWSLKKEKQSMKKEGDEHTWSKKMYTIKKIVKTNRGLYRYILNDKNGLWHRTNIQKIPSYMESKTYDDKPVFDPKYMIEMNLKRREKKIQ